ncbi:MAG: glycyl-radical enzyme activating protein [Massilibacteroides sp.]|nr:glycyl-radical enzyme activating protein [Massilibacteroides sp.]MDD3061530.1 glycyl-radical enzyme activating protein [Massilibacteroides sp.]MDD4114934.1 glycyl-radical enzyme activating protein [Massilibacteroides sp.]MDD4659180.1 glycyl-radical enzyme activating protein [Massilibacteroides sp.]
MALIFDIKRYAINDGPGIRITIFMKGCPLSCVWCHNPEGISVHKEKLYTKKKCIGCKSCVEICPEHALTLTRDGIISNNDLCILCGKCVEVCPTLALEMSGTEYSVDYLMSEILKETAFMDRSSGGVTFCGGEPLMHSDMLLELLRRCGEEDIHRVVDTTLYARPEIVTEVMQNCEMFLVDLKHMNSEKHRKYCGTPNERILSNIKMISEAGADFFIRIPLIEGVNADEENIRRSAEFLSSISWKRKEINLLPYHDIGKNKHEKLRTIYNPGSILMAPPSEEVQQRTIDIFEEYGIRAIIGG